MNSVLLLGRHHTMSFESDCLQLVNLLQEENDDEEWPLLLAELEDFRIFRANFTYFSITFISRTLNSRADLLAKEARSRNIVFSHVYSPPAGLIQEINLLDRA